MKKTVYMAILASALAGCASEPPVQTSSYPTGNYPYNVPESHKESRQTGEPSTTGLQGPQTKIGRAATGAAMGAVAGNVLGYLTDSDRKTATLIGAAIGGGIGYWQGMQADQRLTQAQQTSLDIAQAQSQGTYQYEQPRLYARETYYNNQKVATFDKLETPLPNEAVQQRTDDAVTVLRKLGAMASRDNSSVTVYAPTAEMRNFMIDQIRQGAAADNLLITSEYGAGARVVVGQVPIS